MWERANKTLATLAAILEAAVEYELIGRKPRPRETTTPSWIEWSRRLDPQGVVGFPRIQLVRWRIRFQTSSAKVLMAAEYRR